MHKTLVEMNNSELFSVLAGSHGMVEKILLDKAINWYREKHGVEDEEDLEKIVKEYVQEQD